MKPLLYMLFTSIILSGCASPKFAIKESDNRFNDNQNRTYISENNRISTKSIAGGIHIDDKGVYINPYVTKSPDNTKIILLGFNVLNKASYDTTHGAFNELGKIKNITFLLPNNETISLDTENQSRQSDDTITYNTVSRSAGYDFKESASMPITTKQLKSIANAKNITCKVTGTAQSVIYEQDDIAENFIKNISDFYKRYIEK